MCYKRVDGGCYKHADCYLLTLGSKTVELVAPKP